MRIWWSAGALAMGGLGDEAPWGSQAFPPHLPSGGGGHPRKPLSKGLPRSKEGLGKGSRRGEESRAVARLT